MIEALIALGLVLCGWVLWLEKRVRDLSEERDVLCKMLLCIATGNLTASMTHDGKVKLKQMEE